MCNWHITLQTNSSLIFKMCIICINSYCAEQSFSSVCFCCVLPLSGFQIICTCAAVNPSLSFAHNPVREMCYVTCVSHYPYFPSLMIIAYVSVAFLKTLNLLLCSVSLLLTGAQSFFFLSWFRSCIPLFLPSKKMKRWLALECEILLVWEALFCSFYSIMIRIVLHYCLIFLLNI